jgi:DNA-binding LacI/PurR family transcriptional regulator
VTPEPVAQMPFATYRGVSEMRTHLAEQGFATEALVCPPGSPRLQRRKLEEFFRQTRVSCCVLLSVSRTIQQWFDQNRMPALVLGSCHPGVRLPSIDFDYRTICRHAAGILLARGHRRLALVVPDSGAAGDLASEQGFREAADRRTGGDVAHVTIVRHNGTAQQVTHKLDSLFRSPHPPTALLVAKTQHVFVVLMYLLRRGLQVPDAVSFIARDHDPAFVNVIRRSRTTRSGRTLTCNGSPDSCCSSSTRVRSPGAKPHLSQVLPGRHAPPAGLNHPERISCRRTTTNGRPKHPSAASS